MALNWASELLGELNVPSVFIGEENFLEAFKTEGSFSFTTKGDMPYGQAFGPNPHIIFWGEVNQAAFGALVKWKSGFHVLVSIVTVESERGKGYASELTKRMVSKAAQLGITEVALGVAHKNIGAIKAYEKAGFKEMAQFTNYYLEPSLQSKH